MRDGAILTDEVLHRAVAAADTDQVLVIIRTGIEAEELVVAVGRAVVVELDLQGRGPVTGNGDLDDVLQPGPMRFFRLDAVVWMAGVPELLPLLCRYFYDNIPPDQVPQEDEWQRKRLGRILRSLYAPLGEGATIRIEWPDPVGEKAMISFRAEEREIGQIAVEKRLLPGDRFVWLPAPDPFFAP